MKYEMTITTMKKNMNILVFTLSLFIFFLVFWSEIFNYPSNDA